MVRSSYFRYIWSSYFIVLNFYDEMFSLQIYMEFSVLNFYNGKFLLPVYMEFIVVNFYNEKFFHTNI